MMKSKDAYTFSDNILSFTLQTWTFITEIQVVVTGIKGVDADKFALACSKMFPCNGYTVKTDAIIANSGVADGYVFGNSNTDGVVFVFATADYTAENLEFSIMDKTSESAVTKTYIVNKKITKDASKIKGFKIAYEKFELRNYVRIAGLKWARQNLSLSTSGKYTWKGNNKTAVKVPGIEEDVISGDYFQWAAYVGYCGKIDDEDKGLFVYSSFKDQIVNSSTSFFTFKTGKQFNSTSAPYGGSSEYTTSGKSVLESKDDVAQILLGSEWRIPTDQEYLNIQEAVYWAWDATDMGCYLFIPTESNKAGTFGTSIPSGLSKSDAILFLPACGGGGGIDSNHKYIYYRGSQGWYWSSNLFTSNSKAYNLAFNKNSVTYNDNSGRINAYPIRPVSE